MTAKSNIGSADVASDRPSQQYGNTSLAILGRSKSPHEQVHAILKTIELEIADHSERLVETVVRRGELHALELKMEDRFGKLEARIEAQGTRMILWVFATAIAQATLLYGVLGHRGP